MEELVVATTALRINCSKAECKAKLQCMIEELNDVFAYYKSGEGTFDAVPPEITVVLQNEGENNVWSVEILQNQVFCLFCFNIEHN